MKKEIIVKLQQSDPFSFPIENIDSFVISLDPSDESNSIRTNLYRSFEDDIPKITDAAFDFLQIALAIYTIDQTVSRESNGFQGWSRHLKVYIPVYKLDLWKSVKGLLENYIRFLSGDVWEFEFRQNEYDRDINVDSNSHIQSNFTHVSLLSGGLDSLVGALDILSQGGKPVFVSHYKTGTESTAQNIIIKKLQDKYGVEKLRSCQFWVQPKQNHLLARKENTSRGRSLLFIALGIAMASTLEPTTPLILPENGLISLNIPLTASRISSHSTRTTHPYFVDGLNKIMSAVGIKNFIINPYGYKTKGEMITGCTDKDLLLELLSSTVSCSHPEQSRYQKKRPGLNCGYCVPCIIRQAAEYYSNSLVTEYAYGDIRLSPPSNKRPNGSDYRAFLISLERLENIKSKNSVALEIMRSGPIPSVNIQDLDNYIDMFRRGMDEVRQFLNS